MASVSTPKPNSIVRQQATSSSPRRHIVVVIAGLLLAVGVILSRERLAPWFLSAAAGLILLVACSFWYLHLSSGGLPSSWSVLLSSLMAGQFLVWLWRHPGADLSEWPGALGCAAFTYAMLWVFEVHRREPGLRSLATAALLLSIGILAKPPVLACCALLTLALLFDERRRVGGFWNSALLLLTPVLLCTLGVVFLRALAVEGVSVFDWGTRIRNFDSPPFQLFSLSRQIPGLSFSAAVLLARLLMRKTSSLDLAFLFLIIVLPTLGVAAWMPRPLSALDVSTILSWSAACLLALDPPVPTLSRLVALGGASLSLYFCR